MVDIDILKILTEYKKITNLESSIYEMLDMYTSYNEILRKSFGEKELEKYLRKLKYNDIKNNQLLEKETIVFDKTLIINLLNFEKHCLLQLGNDKLYRDLYKQLNFYEYKYQDILAKDKKLSKETLTSIPIFAIDYLLKMKDFPMTKEMFVFIHDILLFGTSGENKTHLRDNNDYIVGKYLDGENMISYRPLNYEKIDEALNIFLEFYNNDNIENDFDKVILPIIYNGIISCLQVFKDGNTRYGRLLQNVEMWHNLAGMSLNSSGPIVYGASLLNTDRSREIIKDIAINNNLESWYIWIYYNVEKIKLSLYKEEKKITRKLKK